MDDIRVRGVGKTDIQMDVQLSEAGQSEPVVEKVGMGMIYPHNLWCLCPLFFPYRIRLGPYEQTGSKIKSD